METYLRLIVNCDELEQALELQYGIPFDINDLMNIDHDRYLRIYYSELYEEQNEWTDKVNMVYAFLQDVFPAYDDILVDMMY